MAEHGPLGFLSCLILKSTLSLLLNREVKSSAFPAAASRKVSHLLWLPEQRPDRELRVASAGWRAPPPATPARARDLTAGVPAPASASLVDGDKDAGSREVRLTAHLGGGEEEERQGEVRVRVGKSSHGLETVKRESKETLVLRTEGILRTGKQRLGWPSGFSLHLSLSGGHHWLLLCGSSQPQDVVSVWACSCPCTSVCLCVNLWSCFQNCKSRTLDRSFKII